MSDSGVRQVVIEAIDSVEPRAGHLETVKRRGRLRRRVTRTVTAALAVGLVAGMVGVFLLQPQTTAIAADAYPDGSQEQYVACLVDKGFKVTPLEDGSILVEHSRDELESVRKAGGLCYDLVRGRLTASEAEIRAAYELELAKRECLVAAGFILAEAQEWETFRAQYGDGVPDNDWLAVEDVLGDVPHDDVDAALEDCGF